ncbi:hypothetical protein HUT18_10105 [Streptomyces sp. NA04227]|uniref:DUF3592 domain-containing protein n=1 Tax=Streptomyces sp. NA04227 TaxID=2742136 RepID=UPI0015900132|nr:DUF3592 domain-containing protein [Streptomyces sp. NA04227]QKW06697.1 hypothetical protein HUT18_10105 [Streptomyces sp. NA04227]
MELLFLAVPLLGLLMMGAFATMELHRAFVLQRLWRHGVLAEGRCIRTFTTVSGGGRNHGVRTHLHHVYEFWTGAGTPVRFEETGGPGSVIEGDVVMVRYDSTYPARATARPPGTAVNVARVALVLTTVVVFGAVFFGIATMSPFDSGPQDPHIPGDSWNAPGDPWDDGQWGDGQWGVEP